MSQKNSEDKGSFHYVCPQEELTTITYQKRKNVDSITNCLVEEIAKSLDKLRIKKNVSCDIKTCFLKLKKINNSQIIKKLKVDINDTVELKKTVETILGTFDAADHELCFDVDDLSGSFDQEEALISLTDTSTKKSKMYDEDDALDLEKLRTNSKILYKDEGRKTIGINKKNICSGEDTKEYYVGLVNQAMTCYLNSLLQTLYMTPEFRNALYNWEYKGSETDEDTLSVPFQLQKLFLNLQISQKSSIETNSLTRSFGWDSSEAWQQHDIQEFCRIMFNTLEQKFKNTEQADLISRLYEGKISDHVKCLNCNTVKSREDTFLNIPLSVRPFDANEACASVEEALKAFVKYETLEGNDQYFCEKCNKKTNAHKKLKFAKFPYILMLQLKRFDFDQNTNCRMKLNDRVTFPEVLNLDSFIESASNPSSPNLAEDAGLCVKCDDSYTTDDSSIMDEEYASSNANVSNSDHLTNHDQLDDEGIFMSSDMSSSCSSFNQNHEKIHKKYSYELYSIMIHSGSASSGHYYAYIKDFRTGKWLCFNDQNVTFISSKDIEKTYGGGNKSVYCARSTNAYMLIYRQIDLERNCLHMKAEDFPAHIKDLVEKMKNEDNSMHSYQQTLRKPIYCENPSTELIKSVKVNVSSKVTFADIASMSANACERSGPAEEEEKDNKAGAASLGKTSSRFMSKKSETSSETKTNVQSKKSQAKRTDTKKRSKKMCDRGSDSSSEVSRLLKSSACRSRLQISSCNPKPLRRSAYLLRTQVLNYYSFDSDDSPQSVKSVSKLPK